MKKFSLTLVLMVCAFHYASSQNKFPNSLFFDETAGSPEADLGAIDWIQGHWRGEAFGGIVEDNWTPPLGGSMMGTFKLVVNNEVSFYEILTISEEENTLILRLKHFHANLHGWEEKDETVDFRLVKVTEGKVFFDGFTFEQISDDEMNVFVVIDNGGKKTETKFNYKRVEN